MIDQDGPLDFRPEVDRIGGMMRRNDERDRNIEYRLRALESHRTNTYYESCRNSDSLQQIETRCKFLLFALAALFLLQMVYMASAHGETLKAGVSKSGKFSHRKFDGRIGIREDWQRKITNIHPNSPAEQAGLKVGDRIISVDNQPPCNLEGYKHIYASGEYPGRVPKKNITGVVGEIVRLVVLRKLGNGWSEVLEFAIKRVPASEIQPYSVPIVEVEKNPV